MYRKYLFVISVLLLVTCQSHLPQQPQMLPLEMQLIDSIQHLSEWRSVNRFVVNVDKDGVDILGAQYNTTWDHPYEYHLELSAKDLDVFNSLDSAHINTIHEHFLAVLPKEYLQCITITINYTYQDSYGTEQATTKLFRYSEIPR